MVDTPISSLTTVTPKPQMLIPVVDPTAPPGLQNANILLATLLAGQTPAPTMQNIAIGLGFYSPFMTLLF